MRLEKRERRALKELRRLDRLAEKRAAMVAGQPSIRGSMASSIASAGTSKPGAVLFKPANKADRPMYQVEREPRIRALTGKRQGSKVVAIAHKRFANV